MPAAEIHGDSAMIHGVRNFDYRTEEDFGVRFEDKQFDLKALQAVDVLYSYWEGNQAIAHTMFSLDFGGDDVLCLSVEIRCAIGQDGGARKGTCGVDRLNRPRARGSRSQALGARTAWRMFDPRQTCRRSAGAGSCPQSRFP
jgi:hypothetical protein